MEQVIKFRMWNNVKDNPSASKMFYDTDEVMECLKQQLLFNDKSHKFYSLGYDQCGDGNVFMQFTGLFDKHGKEIYCGDILKGVSYNTFSKGQSDNYEVIWGVDGWHIKGTYFSIQELRNYCNNDIEIIGNIHQNSK